jgi:hypothetical protein
MMPSDVKPAKIKSIATTNIDELRKCIDTHEGIYGITTLIVKNKGSVLGIMKAQYRSGGTPKLRRPEMKSVEDFPGF